MQRWTHRVALHALVKTPRTLVEMTSISPRSSRLVRTKTSRFVSAQALSDSPSGLPVKERGTCKKVGLGWEDMCESDTKYEYS